MGTREGGLKAKESNYDLYGADFYRQIGSKGGKKSRGGGFTGNHARAVAAGKIGGRNKSPEMRAKISAVMKAYWAERRRREVR